jgi:hypothetical protein
MPFGNPFANIRFGNIMGGGVDTESMTDFNPALRTPPYVAPNPMSISKRFFGNTIPQQEPPTQPLQSRNTMQYDGGGGEEESATKRYFDMLQKISGNRPRQTAYEEAVANPPDAARYQPSKWRRLASSVAGAATGFGEGAGAGIAAGEHILSSPYRAALQDYEIRTQGLESAAKAEAAQIGDYQRNLEMASKFGLERDKMGMESFYKGIEAEQASRKLSTEERKAETDRRQASAQIQRWIGQTQNEDERNDLERLRIGVERGNMQSLQKYREITGGAAQTTAAAASTRAAADKTRADKYQPYGGTKLPTVQEQGRARDLVLEEMFNEPAYQGLVQLNEGEYGPTYTLKAGTLDKKLKAEIERRINTKIRQSYTGFGGGEEPEVDEQDQSDYGDFILGPLNPGR